MDPGPHAVFFSCVRRAGRGGGIPRVVVVVVGLGGAPCKGETLQWQGEIPRMGGGPLFDHFPDFNNFVKIGHDDDDDRHTLDPTPPSSPSHTGKKHSVRPRILTKITKKVRFEDNDRCKLAI